MAIAVRARLLEVVEFQAAHAADVLVVDFVAVDVFRVDFAVHLGRVDLVRSEDDQV